MLNCFEENNADVLAIFNFHHPKGKHFDTFANGIQWIEIEEIFHGGL